MSETSEIKPKVGPHNVRLNSQSSFVWQEYHVALPAGLTMEDLKDPALFAGRGFCKGDLLFITAFDESWAISVRVFKAAPDRVELGKHHVEWSGQTGHADVEWQDEHHEIRWGGNGYEIYRKAVGRRAAVRVNGGFQSLESAKIEVGRQYPQQVA